MSTVKLLCSDVAGSSSTNGKRSSARFSALRPPHWTEQSTYTKRQQFICIASFDYNCLAQLTESSPTLRASTFCVPYVLTVSPAVADYQSRENILRSRCSLSLGFFCFWVWHVVSSLLRLSLRQSNFTPQSASRSMAVVLSRSSLYTALLWMPNH